MSEQWLSRVRAGEFEGAIGQFETETVEFKRDPYRLNEEQQKFELLKDVTAMANVKGGVLLIGFRTKQDEHFGNEQVASLHPFPLAEFSAQQYRDLIERWSWPNLHVDIDVVPDPANPSHGMAILNIPRIDENNHPVLVDGVIEQTSGKKLGNYVGIFQRQRTDNTTLNITQLHQWIVAGRRHEQLVDGKFAEILGAIHTLKSSVTALTTSPIVEKGPDRDQVAQLQVQAVTDAKITLPYFALCGIPSKRLHLDELIESRSSGLFNLIANPPELRPSGFVIGFGVPVLVEGRIIRTLRQGRTVLQLDRDGVAVYAVTGGEEGLSWAMSKGGGHPFLINRVALAEMTYLFVTLLMDAYKGALEPDETYDIVASLVSAAPAGQRFILSQDSLKEADNNDLRWSVKASMNQSIGRVTFLVLREIYARFGGMADQMPFVSGSHNKRSIDATKIGQRGVY